MVVTTASETTQVLTEAAFGAHPERWPLPSATDGQQRWLRAVAAGGQGHYAVARSELRALRRGVRSGPLLSLAHSTEGSLLRQLGWHAQARGWDGRALLLAGDDRTARSDALVGLAADALGLGRFAASTRLLALARTELGPEPGDIPADRLAVRLRWVSAELAMAVGDADTALQHARRGAELAATGESVRHQVKSDVVLAAALCCAGRLDEARTSADELLDRTGRLGLEPLRWAVASLLDGIGSSAHTGPQIQQVRDTAAALVARRGGTWR